MKHFFTLLFLSSLFGNAALAQNLRFLGSYNSFGVPNYAEPQLDKIDTALISVINKNLPENKPVPQYHPEFITQNSETDIILLKQAEVWVTFVSEAAGFTNVLGFYTYDTKNPPKTIADIKNPTVIFPNVSFENSGGGLRAGTRVKIGNFEGGTGIGWFLISNGWQNGNVTNGTTLYSESKLNPETNAAQKAHTVLLNDQRGGKLILGFEDVRRDQNSDNDFNDVLFYVTLNPPDAIYAKDVVVVTPKPADPLPTPKPEPKPTPDPTPKPKPTFDELSICQQQGLSPAEFEKVRKTIYDLEESKKTIIKQAVRSRRVTTNQVVGFLKLLWLDSHRLEIAKYLFDFTCDKSKYYWVYEVLSAESQRNLEEFLRTKKLIDDPEITQVPKPNNPTPANTGGCNGDPIANEDFRQLTGSIQTKSFSDDQFTVLKQGVSEKCLTVSQVKELMLLFSFETDKLKIAKYLYDFTTDKKNYYQVNDVFSFSRTITELDIYLKTKK